MPSSAHIAILLGTLNGEEFLPEQLASIDSQIHRNWQIWASDDGSSDNTLGQLRAHKAVSVLQGPRQGCAANFLSLACLPEIQGEYFAFCDQDDIWEPQKLSTAVEWLEQQPSEVPALFCSRAQFVDRQGTRGELTPNFAAPALFRNALVQNICSGNTMVFNRAARALLQSAGPDADAVLHDWWTYLLVSGSGGTVHFSPTPLVRHRRHQGNAVFREGGVRNSGVKAVLGGQFRSWISKNIVALKRARHLLTSENKQVFDEFAAAHDSLGFRKLASLLRSGVYRQSRIETAGLTVGALFNQW